MPNQRKRKKITRKVPAGRDGDVNSSLTPTSNPSVATQIAETGEFIYPDVPSTQAVLAFLLAHRGRWVSNRELEAFCDGDPNSDFDYLEELGCKMTRRYQWNGYFEISWVRLRRAPRNLYPLPVECPPSPKGLTRRSRWHCE